MLNIKIIQNIYNYMYITSIFMMKLFLLNLLIAVGLVCYYILAIMQWGSGSLTIWPVL